MPATSSIQTLDVQKSVDRLVAVADSEIANANAALRVIALEYQEWQKAENATRLPDYAEVGRLYVNIVTPTNSVCSYAYWGVYKTYSKKVAGARILNSDHLTANKDKGYSTLQLAKHARTWELATTLATEKRLQELRLYLQALVTFRTKLKAAPSAASEVG